MGPSKTKLRGLSGIDKRGLSAPLLAFMIRPRRVAIVIGGRGFRSEERGREGEIGWKREWRDSGGQRNTSMGCYRYRPGIGLRGRGGGVGDFCEQWQARLTVKEAISNLLGYTYPLRSSHAAEEEQTLSV